MSRNFSPLAWAGMPKTSFRENSDTILNKPLKLFDDQSYHPSDNVVKIGHSVASRLDKFGQSAAVPLNRSAHEQSGSDSKKLDYLVLVILSLIVHATVVEQLRGMSVAKEEQVEPVKPPPKVQISFVQPKPKPVVVPPPPKPVVQKPPPPKPNVVPLKKPPKPKVKPKPVVQQVTAEPVSKTAPVIEDAPPVRAPIAAPAPPPPPPKPKVVEKITQPSSGAGYLNNPQPNYPEIAQDRGWGGKVLMKVHVLASGKPDTVNVIKSSGHDVLDDEAVRTVKRWSFVPGKRGTTPIDGWVTVPITFNLQN